MKLGIDITPLQASSPGGIGTSTYEILKALARRDDLDIRLYGTALPLVPFTERRLDLDLPMHLGRGLAARSNIVWLQYSVGGLLEADSVDVFWGTRFVAPKGRRSFAEVVTLYDFWYARHPEQQPLFNRRANRYVTAASIQSADELVAISDATARDAAELFPEAADKLRTVPLGVDATVYSPRPAADSEPVLCERGISRPYILAMDVYNPRKNFETILEASKLATEAGAPVFEIVGLGAPRATAAEVAVRERASELGLEKRLRLVGDVARDDLISLYSAAAAFVYPSVYEGFGMPVLEAMACGTPAITSNVSSLPEVAGDAAVLVDPTDTRQMADAFGRVLGEPVLRERLAAKGKARAATFTWDKTAEGMVAAFRDAIARKRR